MSNQQTVAELRLCADGTLTNVRCARPVSELLVSWMKDELIEVAWFKFKIAYHVGDVHFELAFNVHGDKKAYETSEDPYIDDFYALHEVVAKALVAHKPMINYSSRDWASNQQIVKGIIPCDRSRAPDLYLLSTVCKELVTFLGITNRAFWDTATLEVSILIDRGGGKWIDAGDLFRERTPLPAPV